MTGFIYAIDDGVGRVKIGWSGDPLRRLGKIKSDCSHYVRLLGLIEGTKKQEAELHQLFRPWQHRREWYRFEGPIVTFVDMLPQPIPRPLKNNPLKAYRQREGITQGQLADQLGVERVTVARWEVGIRKIDRKSLKAVAAKTGIHPKDLRPDLVKLLGLD